MTQEELVAKINSITHWIWGFPLLIILTFILLAATNTSISKGNLLIFLAVSIIIYIYFHISRSNYKKQLNHINTYEDTRQFFLVLRSHDLKGLQNSYGRGTEGRRINYYFADFMEGGLYKLGSIIYIGGDKDHMHDHNFKPPLGVVIHPGTVKWRKVFDKLSVHCRCIVIIPQTSDGLIEEFGYIKERDLSHKTIIAMPPQMLMRDGESRWTEIASILLKRDFRLPPYNINGGVYIPNSDLSVKHAEYLPETEFMPQSELFTTAMKKLIKEVPYHNHSWKESLAELQREGLLCVF